MPILARPPSGPACEPAAIVADGARRSIRDLECLLTVLDPHHDQKLWDYYFAKWTVLDGREAS